MQDNIKPKTTKPKTTKPIKTKPIKTKPKDNDLNLVLNTLLTDELNSLVTHGYWLITVFFVAQVLLVAFTYYLNQSYLADVNDLWSSIASCGIQ